MGDSGQERTEEATPRRRTEARKKGTVAKSVDLTGSLALLAIILVLPTAISMIGSGFLTSMRGGLMHIPTDLKFGTITGYSWNALQPTLIGLALLVFTVMLVGVGSNFAQVGFVLSTEAMKPTMAKLNPFEGFKRLFSKRATFDGVKATLKMILFGFIAYSALSSNWNSLIGLGYMPPLSAMSVVGDILRSIAIKVGMVWLVLAALDYFFQRKQTDKQLRMTKEEVKQEMKQAETSPELKMAMARRRRQLAKGSMLSAVKTADVVITNPTHYAIAISYNPKEHHAPIVVAKGVDHLAAKIREVAGENRVPLVPNPPLARALYKQCEIGDHVPRDLFQAVAEVLAYVYRTLKRVR